MDSWFESGRVKKYNWVHRSSFVFLLHMNIYIWENDRFMIFEKD
jgi:hypothetical protein